MVAAGVPIYLHESDIKSLFSSLADGLPGAEIAFNTQSRLVKLRSNSVMWRMGMKATKWALKDARTITKWDTRIKVLDLFPLFKDISRDPARGRSVTRWMNLSDRRGSMNVVHLRV